MKIIGVCYHCVIFPLNIVICQVNPLKDAIIHYLFLHLLTEIYEYCGNQDSLEGVIA